MWSYFQSVKAVKLVAGGLRGNTVRSGDYDQADHQPQKISRSQQKFLFSDLVRPHVIITHSTAVTTPSAHYCSSHPLNTESDTTLFQIAK